MSESNLEDIISILLMGGAAWGAVWYCALKLITPSMSERLQIYAAELLDESNPKSIHLTRVDEDPEHRLTGIQVTFSYEGQQYKMPMKIKMQPKHLLDYLLEPIGVYEPTELEIMAE